MLLLILARTQPAVCMLSFFSVCVRTHACSTADDKLVADDGFPCAPPNGRLRGRASQFCIVTDTRTLLPFHIQSNKLPFIMSIDVVDRRWLACLLTHYALL